MNAPSTYALMFCVLVACVAATKNSGESKEQSDRRHSCGGLVEEPTAPTTVAAPTPAAPTSVPTPAPGQCYCTPAPSSPSPGGGNGGGHFHSKCVLIEAFMNLTITLNVQQQVFWLEWLEEIQDTILANVSLTSEEKFVLISYSLKAFCSVHVDIYNVISYTQIADWGFVNDMFYVSVDIQLELTLSIVTLDGNGRCHLTDAMKNASSSLNSQDQQLVNSLIIEIHAILGDHSYTYQQQLAVCFQLFEAFFSSNPSLQSFMLSIDIELFGSLEFFIDVCHVYERTTTLSVVIGGSSTSDCVLLAALLQASSNSSFSASVQLQISQYQQKLQSFFQSTTDLSLRLQYVSYQYYQLCKLAPFMHSVLQQISCGDWGSIRDIIHCSGVCSNYGCGNPNDGPGPQKGTTVAPTTKPVKPADCSTCGSLIVIDSNNQTILTTVLVNAYATFTSSQKLGFNSCFNKVRKAIWDHATFPTQASKLRELNTDFLQYNNNSVTNQQLVFNLTISVWQGTIGQFVACTQP